MKQIHENSGGAVRGAMWNTGTQRSGVSWEGEQKERMIRVGGERRDFKAPTILIVDNHLNDKY